MIQKIGHKNCRYCELTVFVLTLLNKSSQITWLHWHSSHSVSRSAFYRAPACKIIQSAKLRDVPIASVRPSLTLQFILKKSKFLLRFLGIKPFH